MSDVVEEQERDIGEHETNDTPAEVRERTLPLVVLGEMVIMPGIPVPLQVGTGKSYRAMEEAMEGDRDVLLIFVSEEEIEGYKGSERQQLPPVGVIAKLEERSEEHTSELQSRQYLVCRLLLEKKNKLQLNLSHLQYYQIVHLPPSRSLYRSQCYLY